MTTTKLRKALREILTDLNADLSCSEGLDKLVALCERYTKEKDWPVLTKKQKEMLKESVLEGKMDEVREVEEEEKREGLNIEEYEN